MLLTLLITNSYERVGRIERSLFRLSKVFAAQDLKKKKTLYRNSTKPYLN